MNIKEKEIALTLNTNKINKDEGIGRLTDQERLKSPAKALK